jgi:hypothetical protein
MKKILLAAILSLILFSCVQQTPQTGDSIVLSKEEYESLKRSTEPEYPRLIGEVKTDENDNSREIFITSVDSCEYIGTVGDNNGDDFLTHKGNCKFCRERREIQHQRLVDEILYRLTNKEKDTVQ